MEKQPDWKDRFNDIVQTCQDEIKKTTEIGKKMLTAKVLGYFLFQIASKTVNINLMALNINFLSTIFLLIIACMVLV